MAVTSRPQDKFAFLFTGPADARYVKDLESVYNTLIEFYNFPVGNIWVVGGTSAILSGNFPNAVNLVALNNATAQAELEAQYTAFANAVQANVPDTAISQSKNVAVIYFTGSAHDALTAFDFPAMVISPGPPVVEMDSQALKAMLQLVTFSASHINMVMQQDYADKFKPDMWSGINSTDKTATWVNGDQTLAAAGDTNGGFFTKYWAAGLHQNETANEGGTDKYADQVTATLGSEACIISLEQAKIFAELKSALTFGFDLSGELAFLGKPKLYIRDGSPVWYMTPDIWISPIGNPSDISDFYDYDDLPAGWLPGDALPDPLYSEDCGLGYKNIINFQVWNIGTHPVRAVSIAAELFRTGLGAPNKQQKIEDIVPNDDTTKVLLPEYKTDVDANTAVNSAVVKWNYPFYLGITHECVRAEVELIKTDLDFVWQLFTGSDDDREAQQNLDPIPAGPPPPVEPETGTGTGTEPGTGTETETEPTEEQEEEIPPEPENGGEAQGTGTDEGAQTFRGIKEHIYEIRNPFKIPRKFMLVFPDDYLAHRKYLTIDWYRISKKKTNKPERLEVRTNGKLLYIPFLLAKNESALLLAKLRVNHKFSKAGVIKLPFNILVQEDKEIQKKKKIIPGLKRRISPVKGMRSISGFMMKIWPEVVTFEGKILGPNNKPLTGTRIRIETGNGQRWVTLITDKYGAFKLANISPDVYRIRILSEKIQPEIHMVNVTGGRYRKIEIKGRKLTGKK